MVLYQIFQLIQRTNESCKPEFKSYWCYTYGIVQN